MRLVLQPKRLEGVTGLDLVILEPDATVQDLADAFQPFAGCDSGVYKRKLKGEGPCRACTNSCCTTSIIAPDPISFVATAKRLGLSDRQVLDLHFDPAALERGLLRLRSYPCTFLAGDGTCGIYSERSLICRFFICTPYSPDLESLVHNILGAGLASLARRLRLAGLAPEVSSEGYVGPAPNQGMEAYEREFNRFYLNWTDRRPAENVEQPPAWCQNPFDSAVDYADLQLAWFATERQWHSLTRGALSRPPLGSVRA